jgi:DNA repair protein RadA/Sms
MVKQKTLWVCSDCGNEQLKWTGSCNSCKNWNTLVEEVQRQEKQGRFESKGPRAVKPVLIQEISAANFKRVQTGYQEFDRLMGGGIAVGSLNLLGGEPGIGKSTMLLQLSKRFADQGLTVLYICGEESAEQTSLRAKRLDITSDRIYLFSETLFSHIQTQIEKIHPDVLIIDSVQIVYKSELSSAPGSVTQVREIAMECMHLAKGSGITTFLIGHVTKSGDIAGPRVLEHIVDTVFEFEGDRQHGYRLMRAVKNRFGPTDDVALFQMDEKGLKEVLNPSLTFLEERQAGYPGSVIIPTIEGTRALLVEVQALVAPSSFTTSSRRSTGIDPKRLSLLLAVLEKRMGYQLHSLDVFASVAGGMKITEPAIDLGTTIAIASSYCNKPIPSDTVVIGEVGLGGEVRSIPRLESRLKEASNMGFKRCILSAKNLKGLSRKLMDTISLHGISHVEQAIQFLLQ